MRYTPLSSTLHRLVHNFIHVEWLKSSSYSTTSALPTVRLMSRTSTHTKNVYRLNKLLLDAVWRMLEHVGPYNGGYGFSGRSTTNTTNNSLNAPRVSIRNKARSWRHHQ